MRLKGEHDEVLAGCDATASLYECEFAPSAQARIPAHANLVGGEPLASFATPACEHAPSAFRRHARLKTVIAFSPAVVWLVRPFHELR